MTSREAWVFAKSQSRFQFRRSGGCFWDIQPNSPGNGLRIPAGTAFKIRLDGPASGRLIGGRCEQEMFVVSDHPKAAAYPSANAVVNAVRDQVKASNAYLYIEFQVGDEFVLADELRRDSDLSMPRDEVEEEALAIARDAILKKEPTKAAAMTAEELQVKAEEILDRNPHVLDTARKVVERRRAPIEVDF